MKNCPQTKTANVLEHGISVHDYFCDLYYHLKDNTELKYQWRLPSWVEPHKSTLLEGLLDFDTLKTYQIYHDCGKPYCRYVDDEGKQHFPDHASVSKEVFSKLGHLLGHNVQVEQISQLIGMDMDIHLLKNDGVPEFTSRKEAISLLLTGLAELHSNANMFGSTQSTSFKIKFKSIEKRGKAILKLITENKTNNYEKEKEY